MPTVAAVCVDATAIPLVYDVVTGPVTAHARGDTLQFGVGVPLLPLVMVGYLMATLGALLTSPDRRIRRIGWWLTGGAGVCALLWWLSFASTWCAFAALASVLVLGWVRRQDAAEPQWTARTVSVG